ncbi:MAG: cysteine desulfurase NifS [candidate division Zixibacteria bacterium]|nr:cysteine desulfurase NifS [candidate division Zixibacteria bacterium]
MRKIYLDHSATTPVHPEVLEAMLPYFREHFGNASSTHSWGREARVVLEECRERVAGYFGASPKEIFFTSGGTESDNLAIKGVAWSNENKGKHIITSSIEHHAVLESCKYLSKQGYEITYLPVDKYGLVNPEDVKNAIKSDTILVSIMHINNEVGAIEPIGEIGKITKEKGVYFHTDAVQSAGKLPIDINKLNIDMFSLSAHKLYGPKGVGLIYIRQGTRITPLSHGGHHEKGKRAGTENVTGIVGLAKAIEIGHRDMDEYNKKMKLLADTFYKKLNEKIPDIFLNGSPDKRYCGIMNISFKGVEGESIILSLDMKGVAVSSGSACTSGSLEPSHVLAAMGIAPELAQGSIRFSFGWDNTLEDIDYVIEVLPEIINRLRQMSPIYQVDKSCDSSRE